MKKTIFAAAAATMISTSAMATDIGMGVDVETKYPSGTQTTYNYVFAKQKVQDFTLSAKHMQDSTNSTTKYNEVKVSYDALKLTEGESSIKVVPSFQRRWDGDHDRAQDNVKIEVTYSF